MSWDDVTVRQPGSGAPVAPPAPDAPVSLRGVGGTGAGSVLDLVRSWLERFICTMSDRDLDLLALWAAHTHLVMETYTTPRLLIGSPVPGSGKTTVLDHLSRLCVHPVQAAALSSPSMLTRMLDAGMRTILIDEVDRSLDPKKEGVGDLIAVLNSGYRRGGTRPVSVPVKGGGWTVSEMPTYSPVAMAGNSPQLPEDTLSRTIRVLLLPDLEGRVEESDWELIEDEALALRHLLAQWAEHVRDAVRENRPGLPEGIKGRNRERWSPLKRVAVAAGGRWPAVVDEMALHDKEQQEMDREDGMVRDRPAVLLLKHLHDLWPDGEPFVPTAHLVSSLIANHPEEWGIGSPFGKALTAQRLGRMLASSYGINSTRLDRTGPRGYTRAALLPVWHRMGVEQGPRRPAPVPDTPPNGTGASGAGGSSARTASAPGSSSRASTSRPATCGTRRDRQPLRRARRHAGSGGRGGVQRRRDDRRERDFFPDRRRGRLGIRQLGRFVAAPDEHRGQRQGRQHGRRTARDLHGRSSCHSGGRSRALCPGRTDRHR